MFETFIFGLLLLLSFLAGMWFSRQAKNIGGTIVINTKDVDKDVIRIELEMSVAEMISKDMVIFTVVEESSQNLHI